MAETITPTVKEKRVFTNIHVSQIITYRLPAAGWASILHRVSGAVLFLLLPLSVWLFDASVTSEVSFDRFRAAFVAGIGILPWWLVKLMVLGLIWSYLAHLFIGLRHLWMDVTHSVSKQQGKVSALVCIIASAAITLVCAARLFGAY